MSESHSNNIIRRARKGGLSKCWYGRLRTGKTWKWVKLYADERSSRRKWEDIKTRADRIDSGVISLAEEKLRRPLISLVDEYHASLKRDGRNDDHIAISKNLMHRALKLGKWTYFREMTVESINKMLDGLDEAGLTVSYQNKYIMRFKAFANWLLPDNVSNPLAKLKRISERGAKRMRARRAATQAELNALFSVELPYYRKLSYAFAAFNGLRRNEAARLEWADLDLSATPPTLKLRQKMGEHFDVLPIHPFVVSLLSDRDGAGLILPAVPDTRTQMKDMTRAKVVFADARGKRLDYHALRHTFATNLSRQGAGRAVQRMLMRHSHASVTDQYTHAELSELHQAMSRIPWPEQRGTQMDHGTKPVRQSEAVVKPFLGVDLTQNYGSTTLSSPLAGYPSGLSDASKSPSKTEVKGRKGHERTIEPTPRQKRLVGILARLFNRLDSKPAVKRRNPSPQAIRGKQKTPSRTPAPAPTRKAVGK